MKWLSDVLLLAGLGALTWGAALIEPAAGWIVGGLCCVLVALMLGYVYTRRDRKGT